MLLVIQIIQVIACEKDCFLQFLCEAVQWGWMIQSKRSYQPGQNKE